MTNTGKIARLPHAIRDQLNHRLLDQEPAEPLLAWLNAQPEVQKVLADQFESHPITPQNLSEWRTGAFAEWQLRREVFSGIDGADETAAAFSQVSTLRLADNLLTILTARYAVFVNRWDGEVTEASSKKLKFLSRLTRDLTTLRKAAHAAAQSDLIKPNQASPGVGTARPHIKPCPAASASDHLTQPVHPVQAVRQSSPSDLIRPNQGKLSKSSAGLRPETLDSRPGKPALDLTPGNLDSVIALALNPTKSTPTFLKSLSNHLATV